MNMTMETDTAFRSDAVWMDSVSGSGDMNDTILDATGVNLWYGEKQALYDVSLPIKRNSVTALIGPSGCGKSTLLRCLNRMNDTVRGCRLEGAVDFRGTDIYSPEVDVNLLRLRIGMIFQRPNPFPMSIRDNMAYGPRVKGIRNRRELDEITERCLRDASLYDEVSDRLNKSALGLSGGQQQRLCIARALALEPEILLMDEPTSALDPIATKKIEDLILKLKDDYTIVIVTHNMQQARRISDSIGFMYMGRMVEYGPTEDVFSSPKEELTSRYLLGRFG